MVLLKVRKDVKLTTLGGRLFQATATRSRLKSFYARWAGGTGTCLWQFYTDYHVYRIRGNPYKIVVNQWRLNVRKNFLVLSVLLSLGVVCLPAWYMGIVRAFQAKITTVWRYRSSLIMRPSSLGGGRILRRTLSVRLSVCLSVRPVSGCSFPILDVCSQDVLK